ncbi:HD domain-containing protein [Mucilaginibacter celer]|uniref:HD domain-containing protein n=1 Tax=Mucilaginibacter celer TaxID=2305508 RepID=A0A494VVK5_9SPHI|nr:HD domain-containing protein [Mucilaginibacter celer]AYL95295.1 HD domain-containing protein [Mucilaginibacter celer]
MYNSNILDPIHGIIKVSEIEKWIFSQKPFNRLRRIKQNTFLYLVFPSANHTRFEHSIGVMHLAHQIFIHANDNYNTGLYKKKKYLLDETKEFQFFDVLSNLGDNGEQIVQELRIAALLHDAGHGPMSHLFDHYTITGDDFFKIIESDKSLSQYVSNFKNIIPDRQEKIEHEVISCLFVIKIIDQLKLIDNQYPTKFNPELKTIIKKLDVYRIIQMIEPKFNNESKLIFDELDYGDFFSSIISSFPLDADRMDYMSRDSYFAGVNYGLYDKSRLFMSLIPIKFGKKIELAIKESGIDSVIRFIQSRTHLYNQVYFHKTNRSANCMLDFACKELDKDGPIIDATNYKDLEQFYWRNSDELFLWETLQEKIVDQPQKSVLFELLERNLFKRIYQNKIVLIENDTEKLNAIKEQLNNLKKGFEKIAKSIENENVVVIDFFPNVVFKDVKKSKIKIIGKEDDKYRLSSDWKSFNKELKILEHEVIMFRIYLRGKFQNRETFNEKKAGVLKHFSSLIEELNNLKMSS